MSFIMTPVQPTFLNLEPLDLDVVSVVAENRLQVKSSSESQYEVDSRSDDIMLMRREVGSKIISKVDIGHAQ